MSLLQDLSAFDKSLIDKYHRNDMPDIVNHYCKSRVEWYDQDRVADVYVLRADQERYYEQHMPLNSGHVYTGMMNDKLLFDKFEHWYKDNYITYEEENHEYKGIGEIIRDFRLTTMVMHLVLSKGTDVLKDKNEVETIMNEIDNPNFDCGGFITNDLWKRMWRMGHLIASNFDEMAICSYIAGDMPFRLNDELQPKVQFDIPNSNKVAVATHINYIEMVDCLSQVIQNEIYEYNYTEDDVETLLDVSYNSNYSFDFESNELEDDKGLDV